jgi:hypothetical protein
MFKIECDQLIWGGIAIILILYLWQNMRMSPKPYNQFDYFENNETNNGTIATNNNGTNVGNRVNGSNVPASVPPMRRRNNGGNNGGNYGGGGHGVGGNQQQQQQQQQQQPPPRAPPPAPAPPQSQWATATAPDGKTYYYNTQTNATSWTKPVGF